MVWSGSGIESGGEEDDQVEVCGRGGGGDGISGRGQERKGEREMREMMQMEGGERQRETERKECRCKCPSIKEIPQSRHVYKTSMSLQALAMFPRGSELQRRARRGLWMALRCPA